MGYAYRATVTIPAASGASTLTNFTAVLTGTSNVLKTVANGGAVQHTVTRVGQTVPADLILSSDAGGTSLYNWGWDFYDPVNGVAIIWVKLPSYTIGASIPIYVSVGNAAVSTYQGGTQGAEFDASTKLAYHMPDGSTLSVADFSSNAGDATNHGATAGAGKIDGAISLPGVAGVYAGTPSINVGSSFTVSAWANAVAGIGVTYPRILENNFSTGLFLGLNASLSGGFLFIVANGGAAGPAGGGSLSAGTWYHVVGTYNGTTATLYVNGASVASQAASAPTIGASVISIGDYASHSDSAQSWKGQIDEVRISTTTRSSDWIATEYANQFSPPVIGSFTALTSSVSPSLTLTGCGC